MRRRHHAIPFVLGITIALSGCGTDNDPGNDINKRADKVTTPAKSEEPLNESGWKTIEVVNNRPIIAKLEQTAKETPERDRKVEEYKERKDFKDGSYGEPTDELAEALTVQGIEANIAIQTLEKVYGGYKGLDDAAVIFLENSNQNGERIGFWIGVKKADDRLTSFIEEMQARVDAGEIKAEYIHIFYSPYTTTENNALTEKVFQAVQRVKRQPETPKRGNAETSVDTITGEINIGHNFLSKEQQEQLRKLFPEREIIFEQKGKLAPKEGEPDTFYPEKEFTDQPSKEGSYIMDLSEDKLLAVSAASDDFSKTGGEEEFFGAAHFSFPDASKKLKIGQRVKIEAAGPMKASYPGQGEALYITVLPEYKPSGAMLSESQAVSKAITEAKKTSKNQLLIIKDLSYNKKEKQWTINFKIGHNNQELEIKLADK